LKQDPLEFLQLAEPAIAWADKHTELIAQVRAWGQGQKRPGLNAKRVPAGRLGLPVAPQGKLEELTQDLDQAYRQVADGLPPNAAVHIRDGRIEVERLGPEPAPVGMRVVREAMASMLPEIDYPELILEVNARTGMFDGFTHVTGTDARVDDLDISLAGVLVAESATSVGCRSPNRASRR
jgi:hypothetical protein